MKYTCSIAMGPIGKLTALLAEYDRADVSAPLEEKQDSLKRFADTYIHSGWQQ